MTLSQRVYRNADNSAYLVIQAETSAVPELLALADELDQRSTMTTQGPIHLLNDPAEPSSSILPVEIGEPE